MELLIVKIIIGLIAILMSTEKNSMNLLKNLINFIK